MIRRSAFAVAALLGAFHLWLLGHQVAGGELADPGVVLRWLVALILTGGLLSLRRRGQPMLVGRPAVAMWVLAAVLHGPALANDVSRLDTPALPEVVVSVAQAAGSVVALGLSLLLLFRHSVWALGASLGFLTPVDGRLLPSRASARRLRFLPRPPPLV